MTLPMLALTAQLAYVFGIYKRGSIMPSPSPKPKEAKLFRNNRSQAVRIPVEFELPGDRVLISRDGPRLIIEPVSKLADMAELLARWKSEAPLEAEDDFPDIEDMPAMPEDIL
jgi:antitoxin VapB